VSRCAHRFLFILFFSFFFFEFVTVGLVGYFFSEDGGVWVPLCFRGFGFFFSFLIVGLFFLSVGFEVDLEALLGGLEFWGPGRVSRS